MIWVLLFVISFALAALLAKPLIAWLRALAYRQHAYEDAPSTHRAKTGTPTMGGILFLIAPLCALVVVHDAIAVAYAVLIIGCAAVGFADDWLSIRRSRNRGLRARTKFALTAIVGIVFLMIVHQAGVFEPTRLFGIGVVPTWVWYALSFCVILATTHAVNLTDGLDGLAAGTLLPPLAVLIVVAWREGAASALAMMLAAGGAVIAFLLYNRHPAQLFMGDTGSLALGGVLAGGAILLNMQLLLPLIGGVFAAETLSVIVQVASYKATKRRVFRMSPLHHHFELGGWPETKVTARFWIASLALAAAGLFLVTVSS
ncbi:MAG TPA: phospho-N-acetylmuramoyl-pentapeptide-transferase [Candidatus Binatia bacterium]|nr:phospho-N-acetylmuramoyl-pentapeptide-transferase [Candidatus Binatia bacterium]